MFTPAVFKKSRCLLLVISVLYSIYCYCRCKNLKGQSIHVAGFCAILRNDNQWNVKNRKWTHSGRFSNMYISSISVNISTTLNAICITWVSLSIRNFSSAASGRNLIRSWTELKFWRLLCYCIKCDSTNMVLHVHNNVGLIRSRSTLSHEGPYQ